MLLKESKNVFEVTKESTEQSKDKKTDIPVLILLGTARVEKGKGSKVYENVCGEWMLSAFSVSTQVDINPGDTIELLPDADKFKCIKIEGVK